jgi:hypothetical protein
MGIQEGCWDCASCEGTNLGRHIKCQGCGETRGEDVEFYLPEDAADILPDNPLYAQAEAGADWLCPYCDTSNLATVPQCKQCGGAAQSEGEAREVKEVEDASKAALDAAQDPGHPAKVAEAAKAAEAAQGGGNAGKFILGGMVCFFLFIFWLGRTSEAKMVVDRTQWVRKIHVEKFGTYREEDWRDRVPGNARTLSSQQKQRSTRDVYSHTETRTRNVTEKVKVGVEKYKCGKINKGNGFFEDKYCERDKIEERTRTETYPEKIYRKEPVYDTWVTYDVDKWKATDPLVAKANDHKPTWPPFTPSNTLRESRREAEYTVWVKDSASGKTYDKKVKEEARFLKMAPGTGVTGVVTNAGHLNKVLLPGEKS